MIRECSDERLLAQKVGSSRAADLVSRWLATDRTNWGNLEHSIRLHVCAATTRLGIFHRLILNKILHLISLTLPVPSLCLQKYQYFTQLFSTCYMLLFYIFSFWFSTFFQRHLNIVLVFNRYLNVVSMWFFHNIWYQVFEFWYQSFFASQNLGYTVSKINLHNFGNTSCILSPRAYSIKLNK